MREYDARRFTDARIGRFGFGRVLALAPVSLLALVESPAGQQVQHLLDDADDEGALRDLELLFKFGRQAARRKRRSQHKRNPTDGKIRPRWHTLAEVAQRLDVSPPTVTRMRRRGEIEVQTIGKRPKVASSSLERLVRMRTSDPEDD